MKFSLKSATSSGRLGIISNIPRLPDLEIETPHAFLYTQGGTVPHLVHEVLQRVTTQKLGLNIPISSITNLQDRLKLCQCNIAEFIGMKEYFTYCTYINPGEKRIGGFHEKDIISLWTRNGRKTFTANSYMEFIKELKPDMFLALADGDTDFKSSKKRMEKAYNISVSLFEKCMELYKQSESLKHSQILGALEGGYSVDVREKCSKIIGQSSAFGVVVDGLHDCSETVSEINVTDVKEVIKASLKHIPDNKLRIIHGCWNPSILLDLIELEIDMFDTSYPYLITEQAGALTFPNTEIGITKCASHDINGVANIQRSNDHIFESSSKPEREDVEGPPPKRTKLMTNSKFHMSMMDPVHVTDFTPILNNCTCYTCQNHTRAYVHHLISVKEMLGSTLLMMHNLHHYFLFLSSIRNALSAGRFSDMKKGFQEWADKMDTISEVIPVKECECEKNESQENQNV